MTRKATERMMGWAAGCALLVATATGCGGSRVRVADDFDSVKVGERVSIDGVLSLRGSTPFTLLALETETGTLVMIESDDAALMTELKSLSGMNCIVEGKVLPPMTAGAPRVNASSYELLPLQSGALPVVGLLSVEDGECVLTTGKGKRYWLHGDLAGAIRQYDGARIWIVGQRADSDASRRPSKTTPFEPTGYGVLDEAPAH